MLTVYILKSDGTELVYEADRLGTEAKNMWVNTKGGPVQFKTSRLKRAETMADRRANPIVIRVKATDATGKQVLYREWGDVEDNPSYHAKIGNRGGNIRRLYAARATGYRPNDLEREDRVSREPGGPSDEPRERGLSEEQIAKLQAHVEAEISRRNKSFWRRR